MGAGYDDRISPLFCIVRGFDTGDGKFGRRLIFND